MADSPIILLSLCILFYNFLFYIIVDLQCCFSCRYTAKWFGYTYIHSISDYFPNCYIIWGGEKRWRDRQTEHYIRVGPAPTMNLGRTDILTPSHGGSPSLPSFVPSTNISWAADTVLSLGIPALWEIISYCGGQTAAKYTWYYQMCTKVFL